MSTKPRGLFITVEGVEGVGKSTNHQFVGDYLERHGHDVLMTREPGGTEEAEKIRQLVLDNANQLEPVSELLLVFASRAEHCKKVIAPALASGRSVVSDRFLDASYAYQGGGRKLGFEKVAMLDRMVVGNLQPDLTLLLDMDVEIGLSRLEKRGTKDRIENEDREFFHAVRSAYLQRVETNPDRFAVIDAARSLADVQTQIEAALDELVQSTVTHS